MQVDLPTHYNKLQNSPPTKQHMTKQHILRNLYVDDMAYSTSDVTEANAVVTEVKTTLAQRSFHLTKFVEDRHIHSIQIKLWVWDGM